MPILHPIAPIYDRHSDILILGSFPSVKSREEGFFYGHKQNRFWKVMAAVFDDEMPITVDEKKNFLLKHRVALWDVIASCEIEGSSDSSIRNIKVNDLSLILKVAPIRRIFTNGNKAYSLYQKYMYPGIGLKAQLLPSTSPANAQFSVERLITEWKQVLEHDDE